MDILIGNLNFDYCTESSQVSSGQPARFEVLNDKVVVDLEARFDDLNDVIAKRTQQSFLKVVLNDMDASWIRVQWTRLAMCCARKRPELRHEAVLEDRSEVFVECGVIE